MRATPLPSAALVLALLAAAPAVAEPADAAAHQEQASAPYRRATPPRFPAPTMREEASAQSISSSAAIEDVREGRVDSAVKRYGSRMVTFVLRLRDGRLVSAIPANSAEMERALGLAGVDLTVEDTDYLAEAVQWTSFISSVAFLILIAVLGWGTMRKFVGSPARKLSRSRRGARMTFADVAGQEEAKLELQEVVEFMRNPARFAALGARTPRGVLMDGPPGNGKTLLAKAVAGEAGVEFLQTAGSEFLEMFAGLGARRVRKMFKQARRRRRGCIIFIDEIETIGGKRGNGSGSDVQGEREQILNQLLVELDGVEKRGNVVVIGATNRPDMLDPALVRPGRLDRHVHVPLPDMAGRHAILEVHGRRAKLAAAVDLREVARMSPGFSGAELENLVNEAAIHAARRGMPAVDMDCFAAARDKALMGEARPVTSLDPEDRNVAALHEAGHALVALRTPEADPVHKATVLPRGGALGMVVQLPERDRRMQTRAKLEAKLVVLMAGRAAEELVYGHANVTGGASEDIREATRIARAMLGRLGMDDRLGCMDILGDDGKGASPQTLAELDVAVRAKLHDAYEGARAALVAEYKGLQALAEALKERETMDGAEIEILLDEVRDYGQRMQAA